jgi:predicted unusual protein kinase regulating ubiquinone biosynthesis (AarF/ABC1/UbiB family)
MNEQVKIPVSKVQRASKFLGTGMKVGSNYLKHYARKTFNSGETRDRLHEDNAKDIYDSLSVLKGSALKAAQMMSMDKNMFPRAYSEIFAMSQYSAPPLSYPLVVATFRNSLGKAPLEIFDTFTQKATNAASIGQVHRATLNGNNLAIKIQYPGVADSVDSDLRMVKPLAKQIMNVSESEFNHYLDEIKDRLKEETDYKLELERSIMLSNACTQELENICFPKYYPDFSSNRIITMDWLDGMHLKEFMATEPSQDILNKIGQTLWDFVNFQVHRLKMVHADPHPGNFLFKPNGEVGIIDFGCVKVIPEEVYHNYFRLFVPENLQDIEKMMELFISNEFISKSDSERDKKLFIPLFKEIITMLSRPFQYEMFDFGDDEFFNKIYAFGDDIYNNKEVRKSKTARGSKHLLYINRTYFGLYTILNDLKAKIRIKTDYQPNFANVEKEN